MRAVEILKVLGSIVAALGFTSIALERRFVKLLVRHRANSPEGAIYVSVRNPLLLWRLSRLSSAGAIGLTEGGRYFLRPDEYAGLRRSRRKRALAIVGFFLVASCVYLLLSRLWV
ncbi:hypothetical protein JXA88_18385 [Candidatus Fermentibacteria bacterium]|nr:hypothetical protein [Candidatus Fermentibacteria bacterium]